MAKWLNLLVAGCIGAIPLIASPKAEAGFQTGNEMLRACQSQVVTMRSVCLGYNEAIVDSWESLFICVPVGVEADQVADVVTAYLIAHPASREEQASGLSYQAIQAAWPCPKAPAPATGKK